MWTRRHFFLQALILEGTRYTVSERRTRTRPSGRVRLPEVNGRVTASGPDGARPDLDLPEELSTVSYALLRQRPLSAVAAGCCPYRLHHDLSCDLWLRPVHSSLKC